MESSRLGDRPLVDQGPRKPSPLAPTADLAPYLADLPAADRLALSAHLTFREVAAGETVLGPGKIDRCYFIQSGLAALVVPVDGECEVGAALVGAGDCLGVQAAFGTDVLPHAAIALTVSRVAGVEVDVVRRLCAHSEAMRRCLHRLLDVQIADAMRTAACNARHGVERRLADWILKADDLIEGAPLPLTHQQIASLLGVQRVTVTLALQKLEGERAIRAQRGIVVIRDRRRLEELACSCHRAKPRPRLFGVVNPSVLIWLSDVAPVGERLLC